MSNFSELFNPNVQTKVSIGKERNKFEYHPDAKSAPNQNYNSVIRFVPFATNPQRSIVDKLQAYVINPISNIGLYVDDPRSGNSNAESPVNKMYWTLINTKQKSCEDLAKKCLSTKLIYASLIQVLNDPLHPDLNGKILVFRYGKKVYDKIMLEMNPTVPGVMPRNPFDPINGRAFSINVCVQSGFNNYDNCNFIDFNEPAMWWVPAGSPNYKKLDANDDKQAFVEFLKANSPDLSVYEYQPWTKEIQEHVDATLMAVGNFLKTGGSFGTSVTQFTGGAQGVQAAPVMPNFGPAAAPAAPQPNIGGIPGFAPAAPAAPSQPVAPTAPQPNIGGIPGFAPAAPAAPAQAAPAAPAQPAAPTITGIEIPQVNLPNVESVNQPGAPTFGNLSDVLANL